jgi:hypothetical protein
MSSRTRRLVPIVCVLVAGLVPAVARAGSPATGFPGVARPGAATSQSANWSGYNVGLLDRRTPFMSVSGAWVVPTARQHVRHHAEASATWVGIGGGCLNDTCTAGDETLVQAGTEQDVNPNGSTVYYAWYEVIPAPELEISLPVRPGNLVSVFIGQTLPEYWTLTIDNHSLHRSWSTRIPYPSDYTTAEWVEETPLESSPAGFAELPTLTPVHFDLAHVNGRSAGLGSVDAMFLTNSRGAVIARPSAPDPDRDGFDVCTYSRTCPRPLDIGARR